MYLLFLHVLININDPNFENTVPDENSYEDIFICYLGHKIPLSIYF